jgi:hypothetical protein
MAIDFLVTTPLMIVIAKATMTPSQVAFIELLVY